MGRLLGLDPGTVRCGVAVSDTAAALAFPRDAVSRDGVLARLRALVDEEGITEIVIGRPVSLAGHVTASTAAADELFAAVKGAFGDLAVRQFDERLTTYEAERSLSQAGHRAKDQRERVDSAAAAIMLQNYLDGRRAH